MYSSDESWGEAPRPKTDHNDLQESKNSFQEMLMRFNNRVVKHEFPTPIKEAVKTPSAREKLAEFGEEFNPTASSTHNFSRLSFTPSVTNSKKNKDEVPSKKRKRKSESHDSIASLEAFESENGLEKSEDLPGFAKDIQSARYETFLLQLPVTFDPKLLVGVELSLADKIRIKHEGVKYDCTPVASQQPATFFDGGDLKTVHPQAVLTVKQRIKRRKKPLALAAGQEDVSFPENLKERHPLFGADYAKHLELERHIQEKLKAAVALNEMRKKKAAKIKKQVKRNEEEIFRLLSVGSSSSMHMESETLISQILLSKSLEISGVGLARKKKRKKKKKKREVESE